jgi:predicted GIY-YIG superfamily endonuclease
VYILRCSDDSLYVGIAADLNVRINQHQDGLGGSYTAKRRPVSLAYSEVTGSMPAAMMRERQIKRWSAQKKAALISGDFERLHSLAKRRRPKR